MGLTRRQAVLAGLGTLVLGGCSASGRQGASGRPTAWDAYPATPSPSRGHTAVQPPHQHQVNPAHPTTPVPSIAGVSVIARKDWTRTGPVRSKVNPLNGASKITIHHEGWTAVNFTDRKSTASRIETIRAVHVRDRGWGDIGYHYIIDRAGLIWEGRPILYQGAHVKQNNEHNIGILVLGNFEKQSPSSAQLKSLYNTTAKLTSQYRIKPALVRSHKEINPTTCPGRNLQKQMNGLRKHVA